MQISTVVKKGEHKGETAVGASGTIQVDQAVPKDAAKRLLALFSPPSEEEESDEVPEVRTSIFYSLPLPISTLFSLSSSATSSTSTSPLLRPPMITAHRWNQPAC
jgi:hypothetical protein